MNEEARKARNAYAREWRRQNPEKAKQAQEKYWNKKAEEVPQVNQNGGGIGVKNMLINGKDLWDALYVKRGLSASELSRRMGYGSAHLSVAISRGTISVRTAALLKQVAGISPDEYIDDPADQKKVDNSIVLPRKGTQSTIQPKESRQRLRDMVEIDTEGLRKALAENYITHSELSRALGFNSTYIKNALHNGRMSQKVIQRMLELTGIDADDVLVKKQPEEERIEETKEFEPQESEECKAVRINVALTPSNNDFLRVMARLKEQSITEFCNYIIERYKAEHSEIYEQVKMFVSALDEEGFDD